jgi:putative sterol carrier protein
MDTLMNLKKGNTDAVSELMEGNIDIKGDMALAFRLKSLLHF